MWRFRKKPFHKNFAGTSIGSLTAAMLAVRFDIDKFEAKYIRSPSLDEVPYPVQMEPNLVVEYYSR